MSNGSPQAGPGRSTPSASHDVAHQHRYCIAYVRLDEGLMMLTNIVDVGLDSVRIGQRVRVAFKESESGMSVPMFTIDHSEA